MNLDPTTTAIGLGLINWLITTIVVESELTRPLRDWVDRTPTRRVKRWVPQRTTLRAKAAYLIGCHLCTGTWIGLAQALTVPHLGPFGTGITGWVLAGLLYKAIGHATLVLHKAGEAIAQRNTPGPARDTIWSPSHLDGDHASPTPGGAVMGTYPPHPADPSTARRTMAAAASSPTE